MLNFRMAAGTALPACLAGLALATTLQAQPIYVPPTARLMMNPANRLAATMAMNQWAYSASLIGRNYNALTYGLATNPFAPYGMNPAANLFSTYNQALINSSLYPSMSYYPPYYGGGSVPPLLGAYAPPYSPGYGSLYTGSVPVGAPIQPATSTLQTGSPYGTGYGSSASYTSMPSGSPYGSGGYGTGGYGYSYDPLSGFLQGSASVYNAQGAYEVNNEKARLLREQRRQEQVQTHRRIFDEWQYERANTPTLQDYRVQSQKQQEQRAMSNPPATEVWSGDALNTLLRGVARKQPPSGYDVPLAPDVVRQINFSTGSSSGGLGAVKNLARDPASWNWPLVLQETTYQSSRETLKQVLPDLIKSVQGGKANTVLLQQARTALADLHTRLDSAVGDLSPSDYTACKRFLNQLGGALNALQREDAARYFTNADGARSVGDLVKMMREQGLQFAPAAAGDEAAYSALLEALAAYAAATLGVTDSAGSGGK
jgi:hypothetical protein